MRGFLRYMYMRKSISVILYCIGLVTPWLAAVIPRVVIAQPGSSSSRLNGLFRIQNGGCFLFAHGGHVKRKYKKIILFFLQDLFKMVAKLRCTCSCVQD